MDNNTNVFTPVSTSDYKERVSYDANGNIQSYQRNGNAARLNMDNLSYTYKPNTNQLDKVTDAAPDAAASEYDKYKDIKQGQQNGNYQYDEIGNLISDVSEGISNITWTVYGKIASTKKSGGINISYTYDASGNRISKNVNGKETWYTRDATGNVMSIYRKDAAINNGDLTQTEVHFGACPPRRGSSRLGILNLKNNVEHPDLNTGRIITFTRGNKFFELGNHLQNVLATVSDKKIQHSTDGTTVDYFTADVVSAQDYYPFGMQMPGRKYAVANTNYRYGFNGDENDSEIKGEGNSYTTEWRQYDPRLGRWLSPDPQMAKFPSWSPYVFAFDNPIWLNDPDGDIPPTIKQIIAEGKKTSKIFTSLLKSANITNANFSSIISFGKGTYTEATKEAKIVITKGDDIKFQVIKLTHELTNRSQMAQSLKILENVKQGQITAKEFAIKMAQSEVQGEINQIKVAAETGYRYKGKGVEGLNKLINDYSKDKTINLNKRVLPSKEHLKAYEQNAKDARAYYLKIHPEPKKK